jgi:hypothetical protein
MAALADLAGLGESQGPGTSWTVPAEFARRAPQARVPYPPASPPSGSAERKPPYGFYFLALLVAAVIVLSRNLARR